MLILGVALAAPLPKFEPNTGGHSFHALDGCFSSGLQLVVERDTRQPVATVDLVVDGGSSSDPPGLEGLAHVLEHLAFRTMAKGDSVREQLDSLGATWNGFTYADATRFVTLAPKDALPALLAVEGQRLVDPLAGVSNLVFEAERVIVRNELQQNRIDREGAVVSPLWAALFPEGHPYHAAQANSAATLARITLADARTAAARWYRAARATLTVRGDVDEREVRELAFQVLPDVVLGVPEGSPAVSCDSRLPSDAEPPDPTSTALMHATYASPGRLLTLAWAVPGGWRPDDVRIDMAVATLEDKLSDYGSWALDLEPGESRTLAAPECNLSRAAWASTVTCWLELQGDTDAARALERARHAVEGLRTTESLPEQWFKFVVAARIVHMLSAAEEAMLPGSHTGEQGALAAHLVRDPLYAGSTLERLTKEGPDDVLTFARRWFTPERMVGVLLEPAQSAEVYALEVEPVDTAALLAETALSTPLANPVIQSFVLDNGLRVVLCAYGDLPLVRVSLELRGARMLESRPGLQALYRAIEGWYANNVRNDLGLGMAGLGGTFTQNEDGLYEQHALVGASGNLDALLYLLRLRIDGSAILDDRRGDFIERSARSLHRWRADPQWWMEALVAARLFPGHPVGAGRLDDETLLAARRLPRREVEAWRDTIRRPDNAVLVVVGRIDPSAVAAQIRDSFESWKPKGKALAFPSLPAAPPPPAGQAIFLPNPGATLASVLVGCQVAPRTAEEAAVLERALKLELTDAWRLRTAWSYDPQATVRAWEGVGYLTLSGHVPAGRVSSAVSAARDVLARVGSGAYSGLRRARGAWARGYVVDQLVLEDLATRLSHAAREGDPVATLSEMPRRVGQVDEAALGRALASCAGHTIVVASGPPAVATELGADVETLDWRAERERRWAALDPGAAERAD